MIRKPSPDEKIKSILDAREPVFKYLVSIGKQDAFNDFNKDEMCGLIRATQEGVQASLKQQCSDGFEDSEIPF